LSTNQQETKNIDDRWGTAMLLIKITDVKMFMSCLLVKNVFDNFLLSELEVMTFNRFSINGKLNMEWFDTEEKEELIETEYAKWENVRPYVLNLIKGNKAPLSMKGVFMLNKENSEKLMHRVSTQLTESDVTAFFMNMKFEHGEMYLTTGISYRIFTMDQSLQQQWDADLKKFLKYYEIEYEVIS